jgi:hypothetical protein
LQCGLLPLRRSTDYFDAGGSLFALIVRGGQTSDALNPRPAMLAFIATSGSRKEN